MSVRNVVLFTADDLGWNTPGCFADLVAGATPRLDAFADEGRRFERAHVTVAVCLPSRSVLMSGRYPHRNGSEGFTEMRADLPTVPEILAARGYRTGILGKVGHCAPPEKFGWDQQVDMSELGWGRDPGRYAAEFDAFLAAAEDRDAPFFCMVNRDQFRP